VSDRRFRVGIRCNVPVDASEPVSRFGFDVDAAEFAEAVTMLRASPNLSLVSLHCHVATAHKSAQSYRRRTERMVERCRELFPAEGPQMLDMGGGFFGPMTAALRRQFTVEVPRFAAYAAAVAEPVAAAYGSQPVQPALVIEPGTALVADAVSLVARVLLTKTIRGRRLAVCTGSVYDLKPTLHQKNPDLSVSRNGGAPRPVADGATDIVGYTCMEHDCLYRGYAGDIAAGDYLRFDGAGAYTLVLKPPFIRPSLPIVAIDTAAGTVDVVKREQTFADVFSSFVLPRHADGEASGDQPGVADHDGAGR
jgi:diaminopimelate decarboxylase